MSVWVLTAWREDVLEEISLGLLGEGRPLADAGSQKLAALVVGEKPRGQIDRLFAGGADEVLQTDLTTTAESDVNVIAGILADLVDSFNPRIFLLAAGYPGNILAGRLAASCAGGLVTDASRLETADDDILVVKQGLGMQVEHKLRIRRAFQVVTLKPRELQALKPDKRRRGEVVRPSIASARIATPSLQRVATIPGDPTQVGIEDADVIVAGGKGVGDGPAFEAVSSLARCLKAAVGGSREAVDRCGLPYERQIGQSGKTVAPRCLFALGISGALQFSQGIRDSQYVIAVNTDRTAPIFNLADIKIVGDLHAVVPALIQALSCGESRSPNGGRP